MTSSDRLRVDPVAGQLVIYSAADSDAGPWECVASNERGEATTVARLHLIGLTPPVSVVIIVIVIIIIVVFEGVVVVVVKVVVVVVAVVVVSTNY